MSYRIEAFAAVALAAAWWAIGCGGAQPDADAALKEQPGPPDAATLIDLAEDGRKLLPGLEDLTRYPDGRIRERLAMALGRIGDADGLALLSPLLDDEDERVREAAFFAAGLFGDRATPELRELLEQRLESEAGTGQLLAVLDALGRIAEPALAPRLVELGADDRPAVRAAALRALGFLGQRGLPVADDVVARIAERLSDADEQVRFMAAFALYRIAEPLPGPAVAVEALRRAAAEDPAPEVRAYALRGLARRGGLDQAALDKALADDDHRVGATAVSVIALGPAERRCSLAARALDSCAERLAAEQELAVGTYVHTVRAALEVAEQCREEPGVAAAAGRIEQTVSSLAEPRTAGSARVLCLARLVAGREELQLISCDGERPHAGKRTLIKRLARGADTTDRELATLIELVREPDLRVSTAALNALGELPRPGAFEAVIAALEHPRALVVATALDAIAYNPDRFRGEAAAEGDRPAARAGVIGAVGKVVERFAPFDHEQAPLVSAAAALGALGDPAAAPLLEQLSADPRPAIRGALESAYAALEGVDPPATLSPVRAVRPVTHQDKERWRGREVTARVRTTRGAFVIRLAGDFAPGTVGSFVALAEDGYFEDTEIHRVVPNFVVQAGDPTGTGMGDPGYTLRCEVSPLPYRRGTVGMALAGKDTGGSQFFVALSAQPHLDGNYSVFGDVIEGLEVLDLVEEGDRILGVHISNRP